MLFNYNMYNTIPKKFVIDDSKTSNDFKQITFNGYKKIEVLSELQKNILSGNIEKAVLWTTELHCAGHIKILYDKLINIYIVEINKANISIIGVIVKDFRLLDKRISNNINILTLRNDQTVRNHLVNLVCLLVLSPKYKLPKLPKIVSEDFNMKNNKSRIISKDLKYIQ